MDYEKAYKDALERARAIHNEKQAQCYDIMAKVFPELTETESEDERIRKEILDFIQLCLSRIDFGSRSIALRKEDAEMFEKWIAYLEKQKEQKPNYCHHEVDLSDCSEEYRKAYYDGWNNCNQQHSQLQAEQKPAD